ncbi:hypothetical protein DPMN_000763 [Dreissena polymorpha]|uniref:Uncharacterized protein n=1 Tax=Dreissena polymorpha TaxID=45954 RepID=A0A9D4MK69_DREPO|nr:hypothetical protein DPMN_000763 [Dreissena polymorpha]
MEIDAPLVANLDQEIAEETGIARPIDEVAEPVRAMPVQGRMRRGMDRCERRFRPLDRAAEKEWRGWDHGQIPVPAELMWILRGKKTRSETISWPKGLTGGAASSLS